MHAYDIFKPVATVSPSAGISTHSDYPIPRFGIKPQDSPTGTNEFYADFFLDSQTTTSWAHPYSVA
jgi:endoglucanase Acf2